MKEANILCGYAIVNFKTVQSFGHTELVVKKYEELLMPALKTAKSYQIKSAIVYGLSQLLSYGTYALIYWAAGKVVKDNMSTQIINGQE